jgi:hypothetical protein
MDIVRAGGFERSIPTEDIEFSLDEATVSPR